MPASDNQLPPVACRECRRPTSCKRYALHLHRGRPRSNTVAEIMNTSIRCCETRPGCPGTSASLLGLVVLDEVGEELIGILHEDKFLSDCTPRKHPLALGVLLPSPLDAKGIICLGRRKLWPTSGLVFTSCRRPCRSTGTTVLSRYCLTVSGLPVGGGMLGAPPDPFPTSASMSASSAAGRIWGASVAGSSAA